MDDPESVIGGILLGQPAPLFTFTTGQQHIDLAPSLTIGIKDLFGISLTAGITVDADLTMGYDTAGIVELANDPQHNPVDLLHGFYFDNSPVTSGSSTYTDPVTGLSNQPIRQTGLYLHGLMQISASAIVTISGGLYADISVGLHSTDTSDHVHLDSLISNLGSSKPVFTLAGKVYASADISLTIPDPIGPDITLFDYNLGYDELLNFNPSASAAPHGPPQVIIDVSDQHTLLLDIGKMTAGSTVVDALGDPIPEAIVAPFSGLTLTSGGSTYVGDGIEVDYPNETDLYVEVKDGTASNYYNLIGLGGMPDDGSTVIVNDPFRVFADDDLANPDPTGATPEVVLAGGKNVDYTYNERSDGSHANVLLIGGYGSNTLTGGTLEYGNFVPDDQAFQAGSYFTVPVGLTLPRRIPTPTVQFWRKLPGRFCRPILRRTAALSARALCQPWWHDGRRTRPQQLLCTRRRGLQHDRRPVDQLV